VAKQAQLNAMLDLDKHDAQIVDEGRDADPKEIRASFVTRI